MTDVLFTGKFYLGGGLLCREPGRYTTRDDFAQFLVETEGHQFAIAEDPSSEVSPQPSGAGAPVNDSSAEEASVGTDNVDPPTVEEAPSKPEQIKPVSKMNRSELEALGGELGIDVSKHTTNAELAEAIKVKHTAS